MTRTPPIPLSLSNATKPLAGVISLLLATTAFCAPRDSANWPQFRGPSGDGHALASNLPLTWSETNNIVWKTPIHDSGWSSPVIWGEQVWVTTATADGKTLFAVCVDRNSGKVVHDLKVFDVEKPESISSANTYASPTSLIEEGHVYVHFGTYGTACLDTHTGKTLWARRDLNCDHEVGPGSSLASAGNLLVFNVDGRDNQYVIALDKSTGKTVWKTPRSIDFTHILSNLRKAFSTPALVEVSGHSQLVSVGGQGTMSYDAVTGQELWKVRHSGWSIAARPVCGHGLAFITTDYDHAQLWAVRLDGQGDVTDTKVAWKLTKNIPQSASLLLVDDLLYILSDQGALTCTEAETGKIVWEQKLAGNFGASPLLADGRIYIFGRKGTSTVLTPGREPKVLATNKLNWTLMASPAVADNAFFVRTDTELYRIGTK